jgi:2-dehydropantoate 2-reductase
LNSAAVVNALTMKPAGIVKDARVAALMRAIVAEALLVGRGVGAHLADALPDEVLSRYRAMPPEQTNSLLADRLARRRLEIDARNGVIVREGTALGIPTPLNAMAVTLLEAST